MGSFATDTEGLKAILKKVASDLKTNAEELRQLDAKAGDGDLGVTIELASQAMTEFLTETKETDPGKMLAQCGMKINKVSPSTFGTILASGFMGAGKAIAGKDSVDMTVLVLAGDGAIDTIKKRGKADAGDKTMLDTLIPAIDTLKKELSAGTEEEAVMDAVVAAAEAGMKATVDMKAKFGRAQWFQNGSIGIQDAGATATYYLIKSFATHLFE